MTSEYQIRVLPQVAANEQQLKAWLADEYGFDVRTCNSVRILKRSIDARQRTIFVNLKVRVYINELNAARMYMTARKTLPPFHVRSKLIQKATTVLVRVELVPTPMASFIPVRRNAAISIRS